MAIANGNNEIAGFLFNKDEIDINFVNQFTILKKKISNEKSHSTAFQVKMMILILIFLFYNFK